MNSFDIVVLVVLGFFTILGIWKGFFREVLGLVGVIGGFVVAMVAFGPVSIILAEKVPAIPATVWPILSFLLLFIATYLLSRLLAGLLSKISQAVKLGWLNRLLGGCFGALKGAVLVSLLLMLLGFFPMQGFLSGIRQESRLYEPMQRVVPALYNLSTGWSAGSKKFEKRILGILEEAKVKVNQEVVKYFLYGKENGSSDKR